MANASPRDIRAGFDIFRRSGGEIAHDELNLLLFEAGYGPVSDRSYGHYRKLLRAGVQRYISINRFDVAHASVPYDNASAKSRYRYEPEAEGVQVLFAHRSDLYQANLVTETVGETGAVLRLVDPQFLPGLRLLGPAPGDQVSVRFVESGRVISGRILEIDLDSSPGLIEIDFSSLQRLELTTGSEPRPMQATSVRLRAADEEATTTDVAGRRVFQFFELLEGLRSVANLADRETGTGRYSEPSVLAGLRIASSPVVDLQSVEFVKDVLAMTGVTTLLALAWKGVALRKDWWSGSLDSASIPKVEAETIGAVHEARKAAAEADIAEIIAAHAKEERAYRDAVRQKIADVTGSEAVNPRLIDAFIDGEVLPALRSLGEAGIVAIETVKTVDDQESPESDAA